MPPRDASTGDFGDLYDENVWRVYGYIGYRVRRRQDAEDLTQQTFERALRAWHRFDRRRGDPEAWLITIARNLVIDHSRRQRPEAPLDSIDEAAAGVEPALDDDLGIDPVLAGALEQLGEREREVVALRFGGDMTGADIAELTGLSLTNVQQLLSRAQRKLRARLAPEGPPAPSAVSGSQGTRARNPDYR